MWKCSKLVHSLFNYRTEENVYIVCAKIQLSIDIPKDIIKTLGLFHEVTFFKKVRETFGFMDDITNVKKS